MDFFKGETVDKRAETKFGDKVRISRSRTTKIPKRVMDINKFPSTLKDGAVRVTEKNAESAFKEFLGEHKEFFAVEPKDLKLVSAKKISNRWFVKFGQHYKGIPVHNATVGLDSSEFGKIGSYAASYFPDINISVEPKVNLEEATAIAINTYEENHRPKLSRKEEVQIIYPEEVDEKVIYHLAWKFLIVGPKPDPDLEKYFIVDAMDGKIIQSYTARFPGARITGTVQGEIYPENPTDPITTMPIRNENVYIDLAGKTTTDNSGYFRKKVPWFWNWLFFITKRARFRLEGPYALVQDLNGTNFEETRVCSTGSPCNLTWTAADRDHINVFYHINLYHDWLKDQLGYSWINAWDGTIRFKATVNDPRDNAWSGSPMIFGTNNFARSSDVIYHECTHNILYYEYGGWIGWPARYSEAYAMDEGFSDYFASSVTNDPRHGEGYTATPRNLQNDEQYEGKESYNEEGHHGGTIIGGAAWNLRQRLIDSHGDAGARIADKLILEAHQILSTYPRDYYFSDPHESNLLSALYRAADIDNNLLNGFPYFNDIQQAFHAHGLLQAVLEDGDSYDFSTNTLGRYTGGDLYYSSGKFWANNYEQNGVIDLGDIGTGNLASASIPTSGFTRFGVDAVVDHTYMSFAQDGENGCYIAFRVTDISADKSTVTIQYLYRYCSFWYVLNLDSMEIHKMDCHWVSLMSDENKAMCKSLEEAGALIEKSGYNGCHYCLPRYDSDSLSLDKVLENLSKDLV